MISTPVVIIPPPHPLSSCSLFLHHPPWVLGNFFRPIKSHKLMLPQADYELFCPTFSRDGTIIFVFLVAFVNLLLLALHNRLVNSPPLPDDVEDYLLLLG